LTPISTQTLPTLAELPTLILLTSEYCIREDTQLSSDDSKKKVVLLDCQDLDYREEAQQWCCGSCHSEWEDGYGYPMDDDYTEDDIKYIVNYCCGRHCPETPEEWKEAARRKYAREGE